MWLLRTPLEKRRATLKKVLRPGDEVVVVPAIAGEGRALHDAVSAQGIAGVLARRRTSPYLPGVRSRLWRSIVADASPARQPAPRERPPRRGGGRRAAAPPPCSPCSGGCRSTRTRSPRAELGRAYPRSVRTNSADRRRLAVQQHARPVDPDREDVMSGTVMTSSPIDSTSSHGSTRPIDSRASITNGLHSGTYEANRMNALDPPDSARTAGK